jgi:hypothetical protein
MSADSLLIHAKPAEARAVRVVGAVRRGYRAYLSAPCAPSRESRGARHADAHADGAACSRRAAAGRGQEVPEVEARLPSASRQHALEGHRGHRRRFVYAMCC